MNISKSAICNLQWSICNCRLWAIAAVLLGLFCQSPATAAPFVPARDPQCVAFAPGGTMVATACSGLSDETFPPRPHPDVRKCGVIAVWDVATGKRLFRFETYGDITRLAFSADGTLLAASRLFATSDGVTLHEVRLWDVTSGRVVKTLDRCHAFDFSPDGQWLAVLSRSKCVVYELADWTKERQIKPLGGAISVAFAADSTSLCGIVGADGKFVIRRCDLASGEAKQQSLPLDEPFYTLAVAADGATIATGHDRGQVVVWNYPDLDVRTRLRTGEPGIAHPFYSFDGRYLGTGCQDNGDVIIWDPRMSQELYRYTFQKGSFRPHYQRQKDERIRPEEDPTRFCFSPDGNAFFVGCYGGIVRDVASGQEIKRFGD
jgi:WD40 repeat protein